MKFAIWAYPWDVLDEGISAVIDRLRKIGVTEINLATNYHTVQAFLPHNPKRRTFFSHSSAFFQPGGTYEDIRPIPNATMGEECWLTEISTDLPADFALTSWTIGCHNTRLGEAHPQCTLTTPFGDDLVFALCPSHPRVQTYLLDLIADLDARSIFDRIELESFDYFHGRGFGWHHDKFHTRLGDLGEFLFGVCFCQECEQRAAEKVDVEAVRRTCKQAMDDLAEGRLSHGIDPVTWLRGHPEVAGYLAVREQTLAALFADIRSRTTAELGYYPLLSPENAWMHGVDFSRLSKHVDYVKVIAYESTGADARAAMQVAGELTPDIPLHAGVLPGHPHIHDGETAKEVVDAVVEAGAERVSFYNYGLLPDRNLDWIGQITPRHA